MNNVRFECIHEGLFVGNKKSIKCQKMLDYGVSSVINLCGKEKKCNVPVYDYLVPERELLDSEIPKVVTKLISIAEHIHLLRNHRVLIICHDGKNQSLLVAGYYLITHLQKPYKNLIDTLETIYFNEEQRQEYFRDQETIALNSDPDREPVRMTQDEWKVLRQKREQWRLLRSLTILSFAKILRMAGGAKS